eukprot:jgi/Tetstr1/427565/TSEL_017691.t1
MNRPNVTPSAKRRTYAIDKPEAVAPWAASLRSRLKEAFGSDELGQHALDLLSSSLTAQTLKSYAGSLSQFAEFCHDSENISPLEATTATVVRTTKRTKRGDLGALRCHKSAAREEEVIDIDQEEAMEIELSEEEEHELLQRHDEEVEANRMHMEDELLDKGS